MYMVFVFLAFNQTPSYTVRPMISEPVYAPAFAGNHCAYEYPQRDGQAELTTGERVLP